MQEVFFMYRVIKVLNNNGILVLDDASGQELILLGNGAGFGHRAGEGQRPWHLKRHITI